jgi:hypothetical protein
VLVERFRRLGDRERRDFVAGSAPINNGGWAGAPNPHAEGRLFPGRGPFRVPKEESVDAPLPPRLSGNKPAFIMKIGVSGHRGLSISHRVRRGSESLS